MLANRQLETPIATTEKKFEVGDIRFVERFIVKANSTNPLIRFLFLQRNGIVLDMGREILNFPSFSLQLEDANNSYTNATEPLLKPHEIIPQHRKQTIIWVKSQIYKEHEVIRILQPSQQIENKDEFIVCPGIISSENHQCMVRIYKCQDHLYTIKKATHITNFSIPEAEQMKYIQPLDPAPVRHLLANNHDDALQYLNSLLKTPRSSISVVIFWFPTPQISGNPSNHTPIQKRIFT